MRLLYVALAGAAGALARYSIGLAVGPRSFPWATFVINVTGSFALGVVLTFAAARGWSAEAIAVVGVGFIGSYTTFSTFTFESFTLADSGRVATAALYVGTSVVVGIAAATAGYAVARAIVD